MRTDLSLYLVRLLATTILSKSCFGFSTMMTSNKPTVMAFATTTTDLPHSSLLLMRNRLNTNKNVNSNSKLPFFQLFQTTTENTESENDEIRELIISTSLIPDDEKRRKTLQDILEEKLNQDDVNAAARFAHLWDINIIQIGGEIQNQARIEAEKKQKEKDAASGTSSSEESGESEDATTTEKNVKEKQLWSMVDMMVQSKTLIKKMSEGK